LHVDYIIRALYGELEPEDVKAEKPRMNDSLKKGVAKAVGQSARFSYTADLKLVESKQKRKRLRAINAKDESPNSKATEGMLPRYQI